MHDHVTQGQLYLSTQSMLGWVESFRWKCSNPHDLLSMEMIKWCASASKIKLNFPYHFLTFPYQSKMIKKRLHTGIIPVK